MANSGSFKKGHVPWNKGVKGYMGANRTSFKKGLRPPNWKPIGSKRITKDGYMEVKVRDRSGNRNYMLLHRYLYELHHGEIPKGHHVIFLDQNKMNFSLDNLMAVSRADMAKINRYIKLTEDGELNQSIVLREKILSIIKEKAK